MKLLPGVITPMSEAARAEVTDLLAELIVEKLREARKNKQSDLPEADNKADL